jgi:hypothetical protein
MMSHCCSLLSRLVFNDMNNAGPVSDQSFEVRPQFFVVCKVYFSNQFYNVDVIYIYIYAALCVCVCVRVRAY